MSVFDFLRDTSGPSVAVELAADRVSAASLETRGGTPVINVHASEPLAAGALVPSLTSGNVLNRAAVMTALQRVLERTGNPRRVGLVIPDLVAKVSLVRFEHVSGRAADLDQVGAIRRASGIPFPGERRLVRAGPRGRL